MNNQRLAAKIKATNRANEIANKLYPQLVAVFQPLIGQQIEKQDGSLLAKVAKLLPAFPSGSGIVNVFQYRSNYSLCWTIRTDEVVNGIAEYAETTLYIGKMDGNGSLRELYPLDLRKTDYSLANVLELREKAKAAKEVYEAAESACYPFGER